MNKAIIGIDVGFSGAVAFISADKVRVIKTPIAGKDIDVSSLAATIRGWMAQDPYVGGPIVTAYLEKAHAMPGQGVTSMFRFGESFGCMKGILGTLSIPYVLVTPQAWKKVVLQGTDKSKEAAIDFCRRMYPDVSLLPTPKSRVPDSNLADALCIAHYGNSANVLTV